MAAPPKSRIGRAHDIKMMAAQPADYDPADSGLSLRYYSQVTAAQERLKGNDMAWTTPTLVEICIGLEINGYLPAEF